MSNFCPCCDDFSIDSSRASNRPMKKKLKKIVINVDNSNENSDWIKHIKKGQTKNE